MPKFDHVLLLGILHHLDDHEIKYLMSLIKKTLRKKGSIITGDPILLKKPMANPTVTSVWLAHAAHAAPRIPNRGIRSRFIKTLVKAPKIVTFIM